MHDINFFIFGNLLFKGYQPLAHFILLCKNDSSSFCKKKKKKKSNLSAWHLCGCVGVCGWVGGCSILVKKFQQETHWKIRKISSICYLLNLPREFNECTWLINVNVKCQITHQFSSWSVNFIHQFSKWLLTGWPIIILAENIWASTQQNPQ